jgi:hypothetical protein
MTASASIVGTLQTIPDAPSAPSPESGVPTHANFQSVLEQFHVPRKSDSMSDDKPEARQEKHKDSDPTSTLAVPQSEIPAMDAPRLILPFTTSITLRQDAGPSPDDAIPQDSPAATDPKAEPAGIANALPAHADMRSLFDLPSLKSTHSGAHPKTAAKLQDSTPSQTVAAPLAQAALADPSIPILILPTSFSTTFEQAVTVVQNSSTVSEAPGPDTVSAAALDRGNAFQFRSSPEHSTEPAIGGVSRQPQSEPQKASDPAPKNVTVPTPVTDTVAPQPQIHPPADSNTARQALKSLETASAAPQDLSAATGSDAKATTPSIMERTDDAAAAPNAGSLAFAARLTSPAVSEPPASDVTAAAETLRNPQTPPHLAPSVTAKQIATPVELPADAHSGEGENQSNRERSNDLFAKPDTILPQMHLAAAGQTGVPSNNHSSSNPLPPAARLDEAAGLPSTAPNTNRDITIRIPDSNDQSTAVRFVERAGEIHVSVRTGDAEMAQSLRGGLNDLVNRLEDGGVRTEVWRPGPGSNAGSFQNDSHHPFADPDGSQGRQYPSGSNSEQESKQQNKPRWVKELEGSIGNQNFKEMTQILWQA